MSCFMQKCVENHIVFSPCIGAVFFVIMLSDGEDQFLQLCVSCHVGDVKLEDNP